MKNKFNLGQFLKQYKNDENCLEEIYNIKYPNGAVCQNKKCPNFEKNTTFTKIKGRPVYQCSCGYQLSPLAGTIFEKTTTPLQYWFYAIFLMANTRSGISAKQLERELGVTYKTAWRMFKQIRILMAETGGGLLDGTVEVDETFVGGRTTNRKHVYGRGSVNKQVLMGMLERGGKVYIKHVPNTGKWTLLAQIKENVNPNARIYSDEYGAYISLPDHGYEHDLVKHTAYEFARGNVHTQNIENVWSHLKNGIRGVYRSVSPKYLQAYADEYAFRYNNRHAKDQLFRKLLEQVATTLALKAAKSSLRG